MARRVLHALDREPRATVGWLSETLGIARGTVQARLGALFETDVLRPPSTTARPASLGYSLRAYVTAAVAQSEFDNAMRALRHIPEVIECVAVAGTDDLVLQVVARDADDLYRIGQLVLRCPGIRRTATSLVLQELIPYRMAQLLV
ncbi:Lrp/AsnC family transcriptional regulator [Microbacterium trichothecenolyticum]|nr:Lrp/AsnC family transcriptional regulator [Microbacterium trichothecenolyticum]